MLIDLIKWAVMMICFFLDYNLLDCVEKIRLVSWQGDPVRHPFANRCICSHGNVAFSLHVLIQQNLSPLVYGKRVIILNGWSFQELRYAVGFSAFVEPHFSDVVLHQNFISKMRLSE